MRDENIHPLDQDLVLFADGELPKRRADEIHSHLAACWQCRARRAEIESTIVDFVRAHRQSAENKLPPAAGSRALLRARLAELAEISPRTRWQAFRAAFGIRGLAYVCAFILLAMLSGRLLYQNAMGHESEGNPYAGALPDSKLTPGATRPVAISDICSAPHDEVIRAVPSDIQREVLSEYGIATAHAAEYEVDFLITPGLGGTEDLRNLWPEPRKDTRWNSYLKDQLEEHLHHLVCTGDIDLATAQRQIASNWIVAYDKYFDTKHSFLGDSRESAVVLTKRQVGSSYCPGAPLRAETLCFWPTPLPSGSGIWFGTRRPVIQIHSPRPFFLLLSGQNS